MSRSPMRPLPARGPLPRLVYLRGRTVDPLATTSPTLTTTNIRMTRVDTDEDLPRVEVEVEDVAVARLRVANIARLRSALLRSRECRFQKWCALRCSDTIRSSERPKSAPASPRKGSDPRRRWQPFLSSHVSKPSTEDGGSSSGTPASRAPTPASTPADDSPLAAGHEQRGSESSRSASAATAL